tara:strand:+ start:2416 stop:3858 length:1443 start_codon:yes stop_codon:yes gene_type:complete
MEQKNNLNNKSAIINHVITNLKNYHLLNKKLLLAVSGGVDSTALLMICDIISKKYPVNITAIHINHNLRADDSEKDSKFIENLCGQLNIPIIIKDGSEINNKYSKSKNLENNLRQIRYKLFSDEILDKNMDGLLTAHHLNDHVETFLLKVSRGTGLDGMEGISSYIEQKEFSDLKIYRPLIDIPKKFLFKLCLNMNVSPRQDKTNISNKFSRNRIRNNIIPEFERINTNFLESIKRVTDLITSMNDYHKEKAATTLENLNLEEKEFNLSFDRKKFNSLNKFNKKFIINFMIKSKWNINMLENKHLNYIIEKSESRNKNFSLDLPNPMILTASNSRLLIKDLSHVDNLELGQEVFIEDEGEFIFNSLKINNYYSNKFTEKNIKNIYWSAQFNGDISYYPVKIRFPAKDDEYHVYGEKNSKKLSKIFIERKIPNEWRRNLPIFETRGKILWVTGLPPAKWAKVEPDCKKIFNLELIPNDLFK